MTPGRKSVAAPGAVRHGTYVVCLECGTEFRYDWNEMRKAEPVMARVHATPAESLVNH